MSTISYLSIPIDEVDNRLHKVVDNSNDLIQLHTYMNSYAKVSDLSAYASKADLMSYAKTTDLVTFATKTDLTSYAKTSDLISYATHAELYTYAHVSDLSAYATKTDLISYAKTSDLTAYASKADLTVYAKTSDLATFASKADLTAYAKTSDLATFASKADLTSYAKTSDLATYATISYVNGLANMSLNYASYTYTLMQGSTKIGDIIIPKDVIVESGELVTNPDELVGKYIKLTLSDVNAAPIYINVDALEYHKLIAGEGDATEVDINISPNNEISATVNNVYASKIKLYDTTNHTYLDLNQEFFANKSYVNTYVNTLNTYINTLNTEATTLSGYVTTLQSDMTTTKTDIATLNADVNTVGSVDYKVHEGTYAMAYTLGDRMQLAFDHTLAEAPITGYVTTLQSYVNTLNADVNTVGSVDYKLHEGTYTLAYILNTLTDRVTYLESLVIK